MKSTQTLRLFGFRLLGTCAAAALAIGTASAQDADSVRDRLSPGNSSDYVGENPDGPEGGPGGGQTGAITPPAADQAWYRDRDGRFFFRDNRGTTIYEDQVFQPRRDRAAVRRQPRATGSDNQQLRLGVALRNTNDGILIQGVQPDSAAAQAGLQEGDVITQMRGERVGSASQFTRAVLDEQPGTTLPLTIRRNGETQQIRPTLGGSGDRTRVGRPALDEGSESDSADREGLRQQVQELQQEVDQLRQQFQEMQGQEGSSERDAQSTDSSTEQAESAGEQAENAAEQAEDQARNTASESAESAEQAAEQAADSAQQATEEAGEALTGQNQ